MPPFCDALHEQCNVSVPNQSSGSVAVIAALLFAPLSFTMSMRGCLHACVPTLLAMAVSYILTLCALRALESLKIPAWHSESCRACTLGAVLLPCAVSYWDSLSWVEATVVVLMLLFAPAELLWWPLYRRPAALRRPMARLHRRPASSHWSEMLSRLRSWLQRCHGEFPSQTGPSQRGRALANWIKKQRSNHAAGTLSDARADQLASLPGWSWNAMKLSG